MRELTPASCCRKQVPSDGIVCLDNGMYKIWFARCYKVMIIHGSIFPLFASHGPVMLVSFSFNPYYTSKCLVYSM
jgi:hypothetical protein